MVHFRKVFITTRLVELFPHTGTPVLGEGLPGCMVTIPLLKDLLLTFFWILPLTVFERPAPMTLHWILCITPCPVFPPLPSLPPG